MNRDNYYFVLELSWDPPEVDSKIIQDQILKMKKKWNKDSNHFKYGQIYKAYLKMIPDIERVMLDEKLRKEEYLSASKIKYKILDEDLLIMVQKGYLYEDELEALAKRHKISKIVISKRCTVPVEKERVYRQPKEATGWKIYSVNTSDFEVFKVKTLYEFLNLEGKNKRLEKLPVNRLLSLVVEQKKKFTKYTSVDASGNNLCAMCETAFKDEASKENYDAYLVYENTMSVLKKMKRVLLVSKVLSLDQKDLFIKELVKVGVESSLAEEYIMGYCKKCGIAVPRLDKKSSKTFVQCPDCHSIVESEEHQCSNCGCKMEHKCPLCCNKNHITQSHCSSCRFEFSELAKVKALLENAKLAMEGMAYDVAEQLLLDAKIILPKYSDLQKVEQLLVRKKKQFSQRLKGLKDLIDSGKFYEANEMLASLEKQVGKDALLHERNTIEMGLEGAEKYLVEASKAKNVDERIEYCQKAAALCKDHPKAMKMMMAFEPEKPNHLTVECDEGSLTNTIKWSYTGTMKSIVFKIIRYENKVLEALEEQSIVGEVSGTSFTDRNIESGKEYYYSVFATRGKASSAPATSRAVIQVSRVSDLSSSVASKQVKLDWKSSGVVDHYEIWRKKGEVPRRKTNEVKVIKTNEPSFFDNGLDDGTTYGYRIFAVCRVNGRLIKSKGRVIFAKPSRPPEMVDFLMIRSLSSTNAFELEWEQPDETDVRFVYSMKAFDFSKGETRSITDILKSCNELQVKKKTSGKGTFALDQEKEYHIAALSVFDDQALVGACCAISNKIMIEIESTQLSRGDLHIKLKWPKGLKHVVLAYSYDGFVGSVDDKKCVKKRISKAVYGLTGSLVIEAIRAENYYVSIFAKTEYFGEVNYSLPSQVLFKNKEKKKLLYSINVKKIPFLAKRVDVIIESEDDAVRIPKLHVVANVGFPPAFKPSGHVVEIVPSLIIHKWYSHTLKFKAIEKNTYLKLFFADERDEERYELNLKVGSSSKVS